MAGDAEQLREYRVIGKDIYCIFRGSVRSELVK